MCMQLDVYAYATCTPQVVKKEKQKNIYICIYVMQNTYVLYILHCDREYQYCICV